MRNTRAIDLYLSGPQQYFGSENFEKSNKWRKDMMQYCRNYYGDDIHCFNPNSYWNFKDKSDCYSQREIMEYDLYRLRNSDVVFVYINYIYSLGTMSEIAIAYENNIPIYIVNATGDELHAWQKEMASVVFEGEDWVPAITYIADHYIY